MLVSLISESEADYLRVTLKNPFLFFSFFFLLDMRDKTGMTKLLGNPVWGFTKQHRTTNSTK